MIGPFAKSDMVRLARRGRSYPLRVGFALVLFVCLFLVYWSWFPHRGISEVLTGTGGVLSFGEQARFGESFLYALFMAQTALVLLVMPVFAAAGIFEEKRERTLEILYTVGITDARLVIGKAISRFVMVAALLLTGVPVTIIGLQFGGVPGSTVLACYVSLLSLMSLLTALGMACAALADSMTGAIARMVCALGLACAILGGLLACVPPVRALLPFATVSMQFRPIYNLPWEPWLWALVQGVVYQGAAVGCVLVARKHLRQRAFEPPPTEDAAEQALYALIPEARPSANIQGSIIPTPIEGLRRVRPIHEKYPLLWKERWQSQGRRGIFGAMWVISLFVSLLVAAYAASALLSMLALFVTGISAGEYEPGLAARIFTAIVIGITGLFAGLNGARCVVEEHNRHALDSLLAMPYDRADVLRAKWLGSVFFAGPWLWASAGLVIIAATFAGYPLLSLPAGLLHAGAWVAFCVTLGMWFSVRSPGLTRAAIGWLLVVVLCEAVPHFAGWLIEPTNAAVADSARAIGPVGAWGEIASEEESLGPILRGLAGTAVWVLASLILWHSTCRRFEKDHGL